MEKERTGRLVLWGPVFTGGDDGRWVEAVVVNKRGIIIYVGDKSGSLEYVSSSSQVLDLSLIRLDDEGEAATSSIAIPAFHDAHVHPFTAGKMDLSCNISTANSLPLGLKVFCLPFC